MIDQRQYCTFPAGMIYKLRTVTCGTRGCSHPCFQMTIYRPWHTFPESVLEVSVSPFVQLIVIPSSEWNTETYLFTIGQVVTNLQMTIEMRKLTIIREQLGGHFPGFGWWVLLYLIGQFQEPRSPNTKGGRVTRNCEIAPKRWPCATAPISTSFSSTAQ